MQYQKAEVRARILESALDEFEKFGFAGANMRRIARAADVATGNLYRYFKSKDDIFDEIVKAGYMNISALLDETSKLEEYARGDVKQLARHIITAGVMRVHGGYGRQLLIIADKSAGSKHENFLQVLCDMIFERIKKEMSFKLSDTDDILIRILSTGFVEGVFMLLRCEKNPVRLEELINRTIVLFFDDIDKRLLER